ncbi:MAG TPA: hypothetical protein VGH29_11065 [Candidatus Binataceae bacterium]
MVALSASCWYTLSTGGKRHLASLVDQGAALYVRGLPPPGAALDLSPFAQSSAAIAPECRALGYRFNASRMLPAVLAGEAAAGRSFRGCGAERLPAQAEELLMLRHVDGSERAAIFGLRHGKGHVIYDLHTDDEDCFETPLVRRLTSPDSRHQEIGALFAADLAMGVDTQRLPPFNLTIDDRPVNFDHFNTAAVSTLLHHIEEVCPGAHTDFAWTPRQTSPCRGYLEVMKQFSTGFVWHGLYRHVDHRAIGDPRAAFTRGKRLVSKIEERFGVRLQRIMIFPFERSPAHQFNLLLEAGFLACVQEPRYPHNSDEYLDRFLECSTPSIADPLLGFTTLYRYGMATLTRDRMLAMVTLGLPIIAYAHPDDLGMQRFARLRPRRGDVSYFDPVLSFASSKGLPSRSLEDIATEVNAVSASRAG